MAKVTVYSQVGTKSGEVALDKKVFSVEINPIVVQQAVRATQANRRQVIAHAKDRSEVRGGGKKPWRQKGTGRARHGSIRSPLWIGGGATFGPTKDRNFSLSINKKAKRSALRMSLTDKAAENNIIVLDALSLEKISTKAIAELLKKLKVAKTALLVLPTVDKTIIASAKNIPQVTTIQADSLNAEIVLAHEKLIMPQASLDIITKTFAK